jgi:hypothetical protein
MANDCACCCKECISVCDPIGQVCHGLGLRVVVIRQAFDLFDVENRVALGSLSALVTGPAIISRENEKSGWHALCQSKLITEIAAAARPDQLIPQVPDVGGILCDAYPELGQLCQLIPDPNAVAREAELELREMEEQRIQRAASGTADSCSCAEQVFVEEQRLSIAIYAASGRLITPPSVAERDAGLSRALRSSSCALEG